MGVRLGNAVGGRRRGGGDDLVEAHEINVTPFIDVMLVLLIIFMVAAPLATVDLGVRSTASAVSTAAPGQAGVVTVKRPFACRRRGRDRARHAAAADSATHARRTNASICAPTRRQLWRPEGGENLLRNAASFRSRMVGLDGRS